MQIEEAIEKLKETAKQCRNSKECWENEDCCDCYVEVEDIFAIETVLNELEKKDKVINKMAERINNHDIDEDVCKQMGKEFDCTLFNQDENFCIDCIKEYFYKKVERE